MKLSAHARERMTEMGIDADDVYDAIRHPDIAYASDRVPDDTDERERTIHIRGGVAVVTAGKRIVTVLRHTGSGDEWPRT